MFILSFKVCGILDVLLVLWCRSLPAYRDANQGPTVRRTVG